MSWDNTKFKKYDTSEGYGNARQWKQAFRERIMSDAEAKGILNSQDQTPYEILGLKPTATQAEIKKAHNRLIRIWHTDINPHRYNEALEMSKNINAAYTKLYKN